MTWASATCRMEIAAIPAFLIGKPPFYRLIVKPGALDKLRRDQCALRRPLFSSPRETRQASGRGQAGGLPMAERARGNDIKAPPFRPQNATVDAVF